MSVDDVAVFALHAETVQNVIAHLGVVAQAEVCALLFVYQRLVRAEVALEGDHALLVEQGRLGTAPQVHQIVSCLHAFLAWDVAVEGLAHHNAYSVHEFAAGTLPAHQFHLLQRAVLVEGNGSVEQEVAVADVVHAAMGKDALDVLLQLVGHAEGVLQFAQHVLLLGCKFVGVAPIHGGEQGVAQGILLAVHAERAAFGVDVLQCAFARDDPFGMCVYCLLLHLELDDGDGLVHLAYEFPLALAQFAISVAGQEDGAGVVLVCLQCQSGQRQ